MMRNKLRSYCVAIGVFCTVLPSAIYSLTISSPVISQNFLVTKNADRLSCKSKTRKSIIRTYSKTNDFKDINIDDVLLEAENALKIAQTSIVEDESPAKTTAKASTNKTEFKDIKIDDVLLEAENALKVAQTSIVDDDGDANLKNGDNKFGNSKASIEAVEILSSTLGGMLLGSLLGSVATFKLLDPVLLGFGADDVAEFGAQFIIPVTACVALGGITGLTGSSQDNATGMIVRNILGVPTKALASAIVKSIQEAALRQVEKTTNEIKSIPSNVAKEAKLAVDTAIEAAIEAAIEKSKKFLLVLAILSSLVVVGALITNGELTIGQFTIAMPLQ